MIWCLLVASLVIFYFSALLLGIIFIFLGFLSKSKPWWGGLGEWIGEGCSGAGCMVGFMFLLVLVGESSVFWCFLK